MKTHGQQALSWYSINFVLANADKFKSLNMINPGKLDKDKSNKTLNINDLGRSRHSEYRTNQTTRSSPG